tara:strand:+ start:2944 stop:5391 length:2448 start_codon:yes stop_codon:yes gene_type:complete
MGVISRSIPTLLKGVSQAADSLKLPDHADIQQNATSSPVRGLKKRSGSQYVATVNSSTVGNVHIQTINRDVNERYVAVFGNQSVKVYDINGVEKTVTSPDGVAYLTSSNPREDFKTVTIADYTFVVNSSKTVTMDTALSPYNTTQAIVFISQVSDNTTYSVTVDSTTANKDTTSDNPLSTSTVTSALKTSLDAGLSGFTVTASGPVLWIKKNDGSNFTITASDTQGNSQTILVKDSVQNFSSLPVIAPNNYVVEVKGDVSTAFDNYFVKFVTNNGGTFEEGQWEETVKPGINYKFNYTTMPHVLVRQADGNFRFAQVDGDSYTISGTSYTLPKWGERTAGDTVSAANPTFVDTKINNVIFFRNRLGFLADDNVIMSRVSDFFEFFPETVTTIIDSDPIDVAASHTKVAILKHAVTIGEQLILFSDQTQFVLSSSSDTLTPKTANVIVETEFESNTDASPVGAGRSIYYLTKKGSFAGVREYIFQVDIETNDATDVTIHVPRYIPSDIFKMAVSSNEDVLVLLGTNEPNKLYVNRWLYGDNFQKIINSWSTFTFNSSRTIRNIDFIGTDLYLIVEEANGTTLEKIPLEPEYKEANADFEYHLDHKVKESTTGVSVAYSSGTTTFTVPYRLRASMVVVGRYLADGETSTYVDPQGNTKNLIPGQVLQTTNATNGSTATITIAGDYRNSKFIIGEPYEMQYRFATQRLTEQPTGGPAELMSGRLQLHHFYLKYQNTGFFKVEVTPEYRDTSTHKFTGRLLGAASSSINTLNLETGTFRFPIMSKAEGVTIDIKNDTFLPTTLLSAEWEAMFHMKSRRA